MGLCKCPKRRVTNQFCFEHRVNVCEHCMIQNHTKCVVQSYLQWLQDSDYQPNCQLCRQDLADEPCVRLICYHVFHWVCLDKYAREMPQDTAPAGYTCPTCQDCIFPAPNLESPVADALRSVLKDVNWARAGLGLALLEAHIEKRPEFNVPEGPRPTPEGQPTDGGNSNTPLERVGVHHMASRQKDQVIDFEATPRNVPKASAGIDLDALSASPLIRDPDNDDNKYKRKSAVEMFTRWWRTLMGPAARRRTSKIQRYSMIALLLFFVFVTFLALMSYLSRRAGYDDPMLEPMNNPNIHVGVES
eukprot:maker-scaffold1054_size66621-snap-gene-0.13 protein:Tk00476 transcript:maker-scaffold1054_size66621-snap-gene-0.13-mRNA-1 annotation:"zinc finger 1"